MGEEPNCRSQRYNRRRRKLPLPGISSAASLYRQLGTKLGCNEQHIDATASEYQATWKQKFAKWKIRQNGLRFPGSFFRRNKPAPEPDEVNYSTDDDGGFKPFLVNTRKQEENCITSINATSKCCYNERFKLPDSHKFNGKERPKSISSLPVRPEETDICYEDACFTRSDSSLLANNNNLLRSCSAEEYNRNKRLSSTPLYRNQSSTFFSTNCDDSYESLGRRGRTLDRCKPPANQCLSVDSLSMACDQSTKFSFSNQVTTSAISGRNNSSLCSHKKADKLYFSASYPGQTICSHDTTVKQFGTDCCLKTCETITSSSAVAYHPQTVSTPVVSNSRQLSTNPSRRPNDFPIALVPDELQITPVKTKTSTPLISSYEFWLSYDALNEQRNACSSAERNSRNRLSLPIFSRNHTKSRKSALRSSSLSSVCCNLLTPSTLPTKAASLALQQLLTCYRNGDMTQEKISLLLDILDTQERFAKVSFLYELK